ncbi:GNAT family N-acetyltransferase [Marinomonas sp. CT5]|uniref:GNAT family N-acetyltransferase n=1 Tax=Marinomonas sp. CT5 TaxID=2066133 RepID=UPI001BB0345E|nr:N-acetyltransferase [Marinomonas sp. CT5]QUX97050.1 GNAT family N-acetyltransferase [Marinomonas sp. CT5]
MTTRPIQAINQNNWPEVLRIQAEVYSEIEPESLEVLQSKWQQSPSCCFVYHAETELAEQSRPEEQNVLGYLLAHAWHSETPPKLYQILPEESHGATLFLHDLAISKHAAGRGVGSNMVTHLLDSAASSGFEKALLVSVQDSVSFWQKHGFVELTNQQANESYGEDARVMMRSI